MEQELKEQTNNRPWLFKKGQSGNPAGRPKGTFSLKTYAKRYLEELTDEEKMEFLDGLDKKTIWEMAEGKAEAKVDIPQGGELSALLVKFIDAGKDN